MSPAETKLLLVLLPTNMLLVVGIRALISFAVLLLIGTWLNFLSFDVPEGFPGKICLLP